MTEDPLRKNALQRRARERAERDQERRVRRAWRSRPWCGAGSRGLDSTISGATLILAEWDGRIHRRGLAAPWWPRTHERLQRSPTGAHWRRVSFAGSPRSNSRAAW